jgi:hypothetical protein
MTDQSKPKKRAGRPRGSVNKAKGDPYALARDYEKTMANFDRRETAVRAEREAFEASTPPAVRQLALLSMKLRKQVTGEPTVETEAPPPPAAPAPEPKPALTTKPNGKSNGSHAAQA